MKNLCFATLGLCLLLVSCTHKPSSQPPPSSPSPAGPQAAILGTWTSTTSGGQTVTLVFNADGTTSTTVGGQTTPGTYKWLDDSTVQLTNGQAAKVAVSGDRLTLTIGTEVSTFQRVAGAPQAGATTPAAGASSAASASAAPGASGLVTQAALTMRMTPLTHTPLQIVDTFPASHGDILAVASVVNAPANTRLKAIITAVDTKNAAPPNTKEGEVDATTQGSQNVAFTWTYDALPAGTYKIDLYVNDALDRTMNFSVADSVTPAPQVTPTAGTFGGCTPAAGAEKPPGYAFGVAMAAGIDAQGKPVNPGRVFRPDAGPIYAVIVAPDMPANTRLSARWVATDLAGVEQCNSVLSDVKATVAGTSSPYFYLSAPAGTRWPEGLYRVELSVNDALAMVTDFGVCDGPCKFKTPLSWGLP